MIKAKDEQLQQLEAPKSKTAFLKNYSADDTVLIQPRQL